MLKQAGYIALVAILLTLIYKRQQSIAREQFDEEYDFVVVGAGTSGAAVASRLSETDAKVLVLEAGDEDVFDPLTSVPLFGTQSIGTFRDWQFITEPQQEACKNSIDKKVLWPRGKILGGSSSLNYMIFARGCKQDYESWATLGAVGWSYNEMLPYLKKSENYLIEDLADSPYHGKEGPIYVTRSSQIPLSEMFIKAGDELGYKLTEDYNGQSCDGIARIHITVKNGYRQNSATAYLRPYAYKRQDNLQIVARAHVQKVLFDSTKRATGVTVKRDGKEITIKAKKEIILSGGAVGSPHLLMLSGVGPKDHLQANKIQVVSDLPGVGSNLQDHALVLSYFYAPNISDSVISKTTFIKSLFDYLLYGKGPLSGSITDAFGLFRLNNSLLPQIQLYFSAMEVEVDDFRAFVLGDRHLKPELYKAALLEAEKRDGMMFSFSMPVALAHPKSRGTIRLNGSEPFGKPLIDPRYYTHPEDIRNMVEGLKIVQRMAETKAFKKRRAKQMLFHDECSELTGDAKYECIIRHETFTSFHPCCTAKIGKDRMAVVDHRLKVYGVEGLRVADASVMPHIVSGPLQATCYGIAEKAAAMIKADWKLKNVT